MLIYLAGPINKCTDAEAKDWRNQLINKLKHLIGLRILNPMDRDYRGKEDFNYLKLVEEDKADVDRADIIVANVNKPSFGTSMEIIYAWVKGKKIFLITSQEKISPWLRYHSHSIVKKLDDVVPLIEEEFNKEVEQWKQEN